MVVQWKFLHFSGTKEEMSERCQGCSGWKLEGNMEGMQHMANKKKCLWGSTKTMQTKAISPIGACTSPTHYYCS
jgi:hypothetical protein